MRGQGRVWGQSLMKREGVRGSQQLGRKFRDQGPCGVGAGLPDVLSDTWEHPGPRSLQRGPWMWPAALRMCYRFYFSVFPREAVAKK